MFRSIVAAIGSPLIGPPYLILNFPGYQVYWYGPDGQSPTLELIGPADGRRLDFSSTANPDQNEFVMALTHDDVVAFQNGQPVTHDMLFVTSNNGVIEYANVASSDLEPGGSFPTIPGASGSNVGGTYIGGPMDFTGSNFAGLGSGSVVLA